MAERISTPATNMNRRTALGLGTAAGAATVLSTVLTGDAAEAVERRASHRPARDSPHVVIIGAGAAGAVAAYRLRHLLGPDATITVLEGSARIGGRARDVAFAGAHVEVGASILHTSGRRLLDLAATLGVPTVPAGEAGPGGIGVWDGHRFSFRSDPGDFAAAAIARYGQASVLGMIEVARENEGNWRKVYAHQDQGILFDDPLSLLRPTGLGRGVGRSLTDRLTAAGTTRPLIDGFVTGALRNIYNQTPAINAFAGSVALVGVGLAGGDLVAIRDGNSALYRKLVAAAGARLLLDTRVTAVRTAGRRTTVSTAAGADLAADVVVLAAAPELAGIHFDRGVGLPHREFQKVHVTLVAGQVSGSFFGADTVPGTVFTHDTSRVRFRSLGYAADSPRHRSPIWKIFSATPMHDAALAPMFESRHEVWRTSWNAYPVLVPRDRLPAFALTPDIFAISAMESAVSTMEHQAVAAWNVAGLAARRLGRG